MIFFKCSKKKLKRKALLRPLWLVQYWLYIFWILLSFLYEILPKLGSKTRNFIDCPSINLLFFVFRWMIMVPSMERDLRHNSKEPPRGSRGSIPTTHLCSTPSGRPRPQRRQPPRGSMYTITTMEATTSSLQGRISEKMSCE